MKACTLILAIFGALATALPITPTFLEPKLALVEVRSAGDGRAATIFKGANLRSESTFIPANNYCTNIDVVPGGFDGNINSLSVEKGFKCDWYQEDGCNVNDITGGGAVLEVGFPNKKDERRQLGSWAGKVKSVYCQKL